MADWKEVVNHFAADVEEYYDDLRYKFYDLIGGPGPVKLVIYNGYGTNEKMYLKGRVLEDRHISESNERDWLWNNLVNMYKRAESNEVPGARLAVRFQGKEQEVTANEEGFFEVAIQPQQPLPTDRLWHAVEVELLSPHPSDQPGTIKAEGKVLVPTPSAKYIVISDIDDTILQTDAAHMVRMARNVFLGNAHTRLPFSGAAALYRALFRGQDGKDFNPLFYVSSSPWNLYDLLIQFFHLHQIPIGPVLFLRDWGLTEDEILPVKNRAFKTALIRQMLDFYPHLPFILIGDSGQQDPEIYADIATQYPDRVLSVYIRNVSRNLQRPEAVRSLAEKVLTAGSALVLADDFTRNCPARR